MSLPIVNAIWIGKTMGPIHAACLKSFLVTGHHVVLHSYGEVEDAPAGVRYRDANKLLPGNWAQKQAGRMLALWSDLLRYQTQRQGLGLYVDCDVFCLRPMEDADFVFGWESDQSVNGAVLKAPKDSALVDDLCSIMDGWTPPWPGDWHDENGELRSLNNLPWGIAGPSALTHYVRARGLVAKARPCDVFYPLHFRHWQLLYDPELTIDDVVTSRTIYVHLNNHSAGGAGSRNVPPTSPLGRMMAMVA
ncbi:MAG: hypothetical protein ABI697_07175 [Devosia sp.]